MNTPTAKTSLLSALCTVLASLYRNKIAAFGLSRPWDDMASKNQDRTVEAMEQSIPEALSQVLPDTGYTGFPTKAALRSYLSISGPSTRGDETITGFDDLYNELLALFSLKHIVEVSELRKRAELLERQFAEVDQTNDALRESNRVLKAEHESHMLRLSGETTKLRHDFQAATNSYKSKADGLRNDVIRLQRESDYRRTRIHDLTRKNTTLEAKVAELSGLPQKHHWDDAVQINIFHYDGSVTTAKEINDLNHTIGVLTNERNEAMSKVGELTALSQRQRGDCEVYAKNAEKWQRIADQRLDHDKLRDSIATTLAEFKIESPTNSIPDMVRAACESGGEKLSAAKRSIAYLEKEIVSLKKARFGSSVEKVIAFRREHGNLDENTMLASSASAVAHSVPAGWTCTRSPDHTGPCAAVPERVWTGGVPRPEADDVVASAIRDRKFDGLESMVTTLKSRNDRIDRLFLAIIGATLLTASAAHFLGWLK